MLSLVRVVWRAERPAVAGTRVNGSGDKCTVVYLSSPACPLTSLPLNEPARRSRPRVALRLWQEVMEDLKLGPNGSLLYCMEFLVRICMASGWRAARSPAARSLSSPANVCRRTTRTTGCRMFWTALGRTTTLYSTAPDRCRAPLAAACSVPAHASLSRARIHIRGSLAQIELYSHSPVLRSLAERMKLGGWRCGVAVRLRTWSRMPGLTGNVGAHNAPASRLCTCLIHSLSQTHPSSSPAAWRAVHYQRALRLACVTRMTR